jgi:hypothetical protein
MQDTEGGTSVESETTAGRTALGENRSCGRCSLCCTVLRVDEIGKLGGAACRHQRVGHREGGCAVHSRRPEVCRGYRCLWLAGSLEESDRPDRLGAFFSLTIEGSTPTLFVHEAERGAFDASPRLQEIADRFREAVPVRVCAAEDVMNPDRPYRVLLAGDVEHHVAGDRVAVFRGGVATETHRLPLLDRGLRRAILTLRRVYLRFVANRRH